MSIRDLLKDSEKIDKISKLAFDVVDTDQSGYIDKNELENIMGSMAVEMDFDGVNKEDVEEIIKELDIDDDGTQR